MKDSLFELLMTFFEKSLSQLQENHSAKAQENSQDDSEPDGSVLSKRTRMVKAAKTTAVRVFTPEEVFKLTKASYQFLMRLMQLHLIAEDTMEYIINQLVFSESRFVTLQETKWTIRNTLAGDLEPAQLAFLDLVLYQKEDKLALH
ncbi:MAG: DUF494 family protein [Tatlockia sp.]|jgi:Smg protein